MLDVAIGWSDTWNLSNDSVILERYQFANIDIICNNLSQIHPNLWLAERAFKQVKSVLAVKFPSACDFWHLSAFRHPHTYFYNEAFKINILF